MMGDFELIRAPELYAYLRSLGPLLLEACPAEGREQLALGLSRLDQSPQGLATKVEIVHRQAGASEPVARAAAASPSQATDAAPRAFPAIVEGHGRLPLLLQRLEQVAAPQADAAAPLASGTRQASAGRTALVAGALIEASLQAKDGAELQQYLDRIRGFGIVGGTDEMFRALGRSVSGWTLPAIHDVPALPEGDQVSAMRRMIALADEPEEVGRRFREMVHAAIEQFNEGSYGRSLKMFDLARQMVAEGQVKNAFIEPVVASGHRYLAEERIRKLAERPESHYFLRPVLGFFRAFSPDRLLNELQAEQRRDRRRQFLNLLEAHGSPARVAAWERLQADRDSSTAGLYFVRNIVHLLRTIPRAPATPWPVDEEIDAVAPFIEPGQPLFLVKEALQYMLSTRQPRAEAHLLAQFRAVERAIQQLPAAAEDRPVLLIQLDRTAATLARFASPRAWTALVEHALARPDASTDGLSRLADLSSQDLSPAPAVVAKLVEAVEQNLPRGMLGRLLPGREGVLTFLVTALASTRATEAVELLESVALRFGNQGFGRKAQKALAATGRPAEAPPAPPSFSGDLDVFGLPNLLQNLSGLGKTGTLNLMDEKGRPVASLRLENGAIRSAQCGARRGNEALYQLIERPFTGAFAFVRGRKAETANGEKLAVTPLLIEGMRRHGELQRALALVPEDGALEATGKGPSTVPDEPDYDFVVKLWRKVCDGALPREVEETLAVDSYRVFQCLARWVEEGALRLRPAAA
jgi:hypothetical protein